MVDTLTVTVSGKTYYGALDPEVTGIPGELGLPEPTSRKRGRGRQFIYADVTADQARELIDVLETQATNFTSMAHADDPESHAEGRACARDAARIRAALEERTPA